MCEKIFTPLPHKEWFEKGWNLPSSRLIDWCSGKNMHLWCRNPSAQQRFRCWDPPCKVTTWCRQILRHYYIYKELQHTAIWPWPSSKGQTKVNIELIRDFDVENIYVMLRHDACNSRGVIVCTGLAIVRARPYWKEALNVVAVQVQTLHFNMSLY